MTNPPGTLMVIGSALIALVLALPLYLVAEFAITMAHEGGHALTGVLFGGRIAGVHVAPDRSGVTGVYGVRGADGVLVTMAGYLAPSAFGLAAAIALAHGRPDVVLWTSLLLLALVLPAASRSLVAVLTILTLGLAFLVTARRGSDTVQLLVTCTWSWLLLLGGLVDNVRHWTEGGDHEALRRSTWIPKIVWALLFTVVSLVALGYGALLLTGAADPPV